MESTERVEREEERERERGNVIVTQADDLKMRKDCGG
jgi:hypothetical protein